MNKIFITSFLLFYTASLYAQQDVHIWKNGSKQLIAKVDSITYADVAEDYPITRTYNVNGVKFNMVQVEGGSFYMGAQTTSPTGINYDPDANPDEAPVHKVTLETFSIGETEVTQDLWKAVTGMKKSSWTGNNNDDKIPAFELTWADIMIVFMPKLNKILHETGQLPDKMNFCLPTEAQWQFAAKGGVKSKGYRFSGSNTYTEVAWCLENDPKTEYKKVALLKPNELGIYDMSGNVWEWVTDWFGNYKSTNQTNPIGADSGDSKVLCGGAVDSKLGALRNTIRNHYTPCDFFWGCGFRLCLSNNYPF